MKLESVLRKGDLKLSVDLAEMRENLRAVFSEVSDKVVRANKVLSDFTESVDPYVNYFFISDSGSSGRTFKKDAIIESEEALSAAIKNAIDVMSKDSVIHNDISAVIEQTASLQESVNTILGHLETIEMYSMNTMVISLRSGSQGISLATISQKMGDLSRDGSALGEKFYNRMKELIRVSSEFMSVKSEIDVVHENSLTFLQIKAAKNYNELKSSLGHLSERVISEYGIIRQIRSALDGIIVRYQLEDILRQDLEKLSYLVEYLSGEESGELDGEFADWLVWKKISSIKNSMGNFYSELNMSFERMRQSVGHFNQRFEVSSGESGSDVLYSIIDGIDKMKAEFEIYIKNIRSHKEKLRNLAEIVVENMRSFGEFYKKIFAISKSFERIILLTRIEMARSDELLHSLEGALSDVSNLPLRIKKEVSSGTAFYSRLFDELNGALERYGEAFISQNSILDDCLDLMDSTTVKIREAGVYHGKFESEVRDQACRFEDMAVSEGHSLGRFCTMMELLDSYYRRFSASSFSGKDADFARKAAALKVKFAAGNESSDYSMMMIESFLSEIVNESSGNTETGSIEFF